jgi:uroporphyrinogen decarboxylase
MSRARFLRAAGRQPVDRTPVWFMRQAGRIFPEYRALRERYGLIELCRQPDLGAEVALQPVRRLGVDAAILFADIMLPLIGIGLPIELVDDVGPVVHAPVHDEAGVRAIRALEPERDVGFVLETVRLLTRHLGEAIPVIGFSGAPFTLAAYLIEGRASRDFARSKSLMLGRPSLWHGLMERLTALVIAYLRAQIAAGVSAVQLFDSWVGALSPDQYASAVRPYTREIFAALAGEGVPRIHFGTGTATLLDQMRDDGADVISVDWRLPLDDAWARIGHHRGIQGNLDPTVLLATPAVIMREVDDVMRRAAGRTGHIFNLGHGLLPATPVEHILLAIDRVRAWPLAPHEAVRASAGVTVGRLSGEGEAVP